MEEEVSRLEEVDGKVIWVPTRVTRPGGINGDRWQGLEGQGEDDDSEGESTSTEGVTDEKGQALWWTIQLQISRGSARSDQVERSLEQDTERGERRPAATLDHRSLFDIAGVSAR